MGDELPSLLTGGGLVSLIATIGYVLKLWVDSRREKHLEKRDGVSTQIHDAATVNALTMESLKEARTENHRLQDRVDSLEDENTDLRNKMYEQQRDYEAKLTEMHKRVRELEDQAHDLAKQLSQLLPPPPEGSTI